jgi:hypothetical protein
VRKSRCWAEQGQWVVERTAGQEGRVTEELSKGTAAAASLPLPLPLPFSLPLSRMCVHIVSVCAKRRNEGGAGMDALVLDWTGLYLPSSSSSSKQQAAGTTESTNLGKLLACTVLFCSVLCWCSCSCCARALSPKFHLHMIMI